MDIRPLSGALGAEIAGVDLAQALDDGPLGDETLAEVRRALDRHLMVAFRGQNLSPGQQIALTRRLGPLLRVPFIEPLPEHPEIVAVLKEAEERDISTFGGVWHSDFSFLEAPPSYTLLYALEVPPRGGDTIWANMALAYETLSAGMKGLLGGLRAVRYAASAWRFDRERDAMPERYKGTQTECLWRAFKSGATMPIGVRQLRNILGH